MLTRCRGIVAAKINQLHGSQSHIDSLDTSVFIASCNPSHAAVTFAVRTFGQLLADSVLMPPMQILDWLCSMTSDTALHDLSPGKWRPYCI
jgi:hypothetical protein